MILLCVDSSAGSSAALVVDGEIMASFAQRETSSHAEVLAPAIHQLFASAGIGAEQLDAVVTGVGPGPFTGLRVGIAFAQSVALARDIPLYGVSSLDSLAMQAQRGGVGKPVLAVTDARRREVYWAHYRFDRDWPELLQGPTVSSADACPQIPAVGPGLKLYSEALSSAPVLNRSQVPDCESQLSHELASNAEPESSHASAHPQAQSAGEASHLSPEQWVPEAADLGLIAAAELDGRTSGFLRPPIPLYLRESDAKVPPRMAQPS